MMRSEKVLDSTETNDAIRKRPRSDLSSLHLKLFGIIAVVVFSFPVVSAKPTPSQTNPCKPTEYWVEKEDGSQECIACGTCPEGQGLSTECGSSELLPSNTMVKCLACTKGVSFSRYDDSSICLPCASCSKGQVVEQSCSPKWDVKCANKCSSKDRYYDMDKGDCFKCSRCCGDDRDVVVKECKEKLGDGSNMVCSFDSSVNRCGKTTPQPTTIISHVDPKHDGPYTTQKSDHSTKANDRTTTVILVVIIVFFAFCVCSCVFKKRLAQMLSWCYRTVEVEDHHDLSVMEDGSSTDGKGENAKENLEESDESYELGVVHSVAEEPLLKEGIPKILDDTVTTKEKGVIELQLERDFELTVRGIYC